MHNSSDHSRKDLRYVHTYIPILTRTYLSPSLCVIPLLATLNYLRQAFHMCFIHLYPPIIMFNGSAHLRKDLCYKREHVTILLHAYVSRSLRAFALNPVAMTHYVHLL